MSGQAAFSTSWSFLCCMPERFINYCLFTWTGVLRKINITFQEKKAGIYMVCVMLPATVLCFARAPACPASQLSLLTFNRKSSRTGTLVLQHCKINLETALGLLSNVFSKYLANSYSEISTEKAPDSWTKQALGSCRITKYYLTVCVYVRSNPAALVKRFWTTKEGGPISAEMSPVCSCGLCWFIVFVCVLVELGFWPP